MLRHIVSYLTDMRAANHFTAMISVSRRTILAYVQKCFTNFRAFKLCATSSGSAALPSLCVEVRWNPPHATWYHQILSSDKRSVCIAARMICLFRRQSRLISLRAGPELAVDAGLSDAAADQMAHLLRPCWVNPNVGVQAKCPIKCGEGPQRLDTHDDPAFWPSGPRQGDS